MGSAVKIESGGKPESVMTPQVHRITVAGIFLATLPMDTGC
jgi:hypothetical protein